MEILILRGSEYSDNLVFKTLQFFLATRISEEYDVPSPG
jgi:hypothetical protein